MILIILFLKFINIFLIIYFYSFILFLGLISIFYGTIIALYETKIIRLFAFASISHVGYILIGITQISISSLASIIFYLFMYILLILTFFCVLSFLCAPKGHKAPYDLTLMDLVSV
jgi:NADH-quinone oxidoreductase subunit N